MNRIALALVLGIGFCANAYADVSMLDQHGFVRAAKPGDKRADRPASVRTGERALTDNSNLEYFINSNITFATSSSASGAASEASYTGPVAADTSGGGTVNSTLNDAFDGFGTICISTTGATGPCETGNAAFTIFNSNGPATLDAACNNRQVVYANQTVGSVVMTRKVFVPSNDAFIRWLNVFTNSGGAPVTFNVITSNNLGSDANTTLVSSSDGDATAEITDTWITSFQNFSGTTSSDPRLAHVTQGAGAAVPVSAITFVNGDDNPFWSYTLTLQPGQTRSIVTFASGQPTRAAAAAKAAQLAAFPTSAQQCLTGTELGQIANFGAGTGASFSAAVPAGNRYGWAALIGVLLALGVLVARRAQTSA